MEHTITCQVRASHTLTVSLRASAPTVVFAGLPLTTMWPFTTPYPQRSLRELEQEYDYIVVGGGFDTIKNACGNVFDATSRWNCGMCLGSTTGRRSYLYCPPRRTWGCEGQLARPLSPALHSSLVRPKAQRILQRRHPGRQNH